MPGQDVTFPALYLRHVADQVRGLGGDVELWLRSSELREAQLLDPDLVIAFPVLRKLVLEAIELTHEPALGLFVGRALSALTHGMLGYGVMNSGTIRQAIGLFERFVRLRMSLLSIAQEVHRDEVRVCFRETYALDDIQRPVLEAAVLSVKNVFDTISLGGCRIARVAFPFGAPAHAGFTRELFGCEVGYRQTWAGFAVPVEVLDVPLKLADPQAYETAAQICQRELDKLAAHESLAVRVRRLLLENQSGFPSLQVAARMFHLTPRTLHRRLGDEGTSFRDILEDVRHTLAVEHMKSGRWSIEELAYTLGYSDLANFRRAFKRWEGVPPSEFRQQVGAKERAGAGGPAPSHEAKASRRRPGRGRSS
jgi:AraC-like DNA-binding protein